MIAADTNINATKKEKTMKTFLLCLILAFIVLPAFATEPANHQHADSWLRPVEAKYTCMMNNAVYDKEQMAIEVEGKTYYGCCAMCKDMLQKDPSKRSATDPVSGKSVDKASAVIGADKQDRVYYFENNENFHKFASGPMPEMKHESMEGMDMKGHMMMEGHDMGAKAMSSEKPQQTSEGYRNILTTASRFQGFVKFP